MIAIHHICIQTNDYQASLDFYTKILRFEVVKESKDFHNRKCNTWLKNNGIMIELQTGKGHQILENYSTKNLGIAHIGFYCDDIEREYTKIKEFGFINFVLKNGEAIYQVFDSKLFKMIAPEGTIIEVRNSESL